MGDMGTNIAVRTQSRGMIQSSDGTLGVGRVSACDVPEQYDAALIEEDVPNAQCGF
jgi:hypothetical protein